MLLLHYHEMKEDPLYNFLEISHFLGMDLTTEHIRGVIANTSVNAMHKLEEHHDLPHTNRFVVRGCAPTDVQDTMHCCVSMALGARFVCVVPDCATLSEWLQHVLDLSHRIVLKNRLFCVCCAMMMQLRLQLMVLCAKAYMPLSLL